MRFGKAIEVRRYLGNFRSIPRQMGLGNFPRCAENEIDLHIEQIRCRGKGACGRCRSGELAFSEA